MFKKRVVVNEITKYLDANMDKGSPIDMIEEIFGNPHYACFLFITSRAEPPIFIQFIKDNIVEILKYTIKDPPAERKNDLRFFMVSRNSAIALSHPSSKTMKTLLELDDFRKIMVHFVDSKDANNNTSIHWGRIMSNYVARKYFLDDIDYLIPKLILNIDYLGYYNLLEYIITNTNYNHKIFNEIAESIHQNSKEYFRSYHDDTNSILFKRIYNLLNLFHSSYYEIGDNINLGSWEDRYKIVKNLINVIIFSTKNKIILDAGVRALCIVIKLLDKSFDKYDIKEEKDDENCEINFDDLDLDESNEPINIYAKKIRKLIVAKGKSFYSQQGLYDLTKYKITPEITKEEIDKLDIIIQTFPVFWEAGINQLSPLLFRGCRSTKEGTKYPQNLEDSIVPLKVGKTIIDQVIKWISIITDKDQNLFGEDSQASNKIRKYEKKQAFKKLYEFIENNDIVNKLKKYFPRTFLNENKNVVFLNPYIIYLAELLSVGHLKLTLDYDEAHESYIKSEKIGICNSIKVLPPSMKSEEFNKFVFDYIIEISNEIKKDVLDFVQNDG